jgi:chemotaxis family two-component system response regulator Rcp1
MNNEELGRPIEILLVEDSPGDVRLTQEVFKASKIRNRLHITRDGEEAMSFLRNGSSGTDAVRPDLILLDLNLPKKDGREVLAEIKADEDLRQIPVIVLTVSSAEEDILRSYNLHANCYLTKPIEFARFVKLVQSIEEFWLTIVRLPSR